MSWQPGETINTVTRFRRLSQSIPSSYTIWKDGTQAKAECNIAGGADFLTGTDSVVIQSAIDASSMNGTEIFFKAGTYDIAVPLSVVGAGKVTLRGEQRESTILKNTTLTSQLIQVGDGVTDFAGNLILDNLRLHGNDKDVTLVKLLNTADHIVPRFFHCDFIAFGGKTTGTKYAIDSGDTYHFYDSHIVDCYFAFGKGAFRVLHSDQMFRDCTFGDLNYGLDIQAGNVRVFGGLFTQNARDISIPDGTDLPLAQRFSGIHFENSTDTLIGSDTSTNLNLLFSGCHFHSFGAAWLFYLSGCTGRLTFIGGQIDTTGTVGKAFGSVKVKAINLSGYTTENSGSSTGTGAQQTIAHGLAGTPNRVILWNIEDGANPYQSAAADDTNIYVTAVTNQDWGWEAKIV